MSRGYTTSQDRSRRRKATVIVIVGVVVLVGWIAAVAALAGQSDPSGSRSAGNGGSQQGGAEGAGAGDTSQQQTAPEQTNDEEEGEPSEQDPGQTEQAMAGEGTPPQDGQPPVDGGADTGEVFDPLEEDSQQGASQQHSGSSERQQPTGGGPAEIDRTRARAASERFITAAYGYTGGSSEDYLGAVEQATAEEIHDSPGGSMLKGYSKAAPECGMKSTAILEEFEIIGRSVDGLDASVTFTVEDGSSDSSDGQTHTYRQDQRLISSDGAYEVSAVSMEELISQTTPRESCPGSQSSDASSEGGQDEIKPDSLGVADEDQVRSAADRYITSAYGYTGDSGEEYRKGVERVVDLAAFLNSPGGEQVRVYAKAAEEDGITAAAVMESFEISSTEGQKVEGTAYFRVGSSYDRYGELEGEGKPFAVNLTLTPTNSAYEISTASLEWQRSGGQTLDPRTKKTS